MELPAWEDALIETLHRNGRGRVLKALLALGGEASTAAILERGGVPHGSRTKFFGDLERRGLITKIEHARGGADQQSHVYELTGEGTRIAEALMDEQVADPLVREEPDAAGEIRSTLADMERRLACMERDTYGSAEGREHVEGLREEVEQLEARLESLGEELHKKETAAETDSEAASGSAAVPGGQVVD